MLLRIYHMDMCAYRLSSFALGSGRLTQKCYGSSNKARRATTITSRLAALGHDAQQPAHTALEALEANGTALEVRDGGAGVPAADVVTKMHIKLLKLKVLEAECAAADAMERERAALEKCESMEAAMAKLTQRLERREAMGWGQSEAQEVVQLTLELEEAQAELAAAKADEEMAMSLFTDANSKLEALEGARDAAMQDAHYWRGEVRDLKVELYDSRNTAAALQAQLDSALAQLEEVQAKLAETERSKAELEDENAQLREQLVALRKDAQLKMRGVAEQVSLLAHTLEAIEAKHTQRGQEGAGSAENGNGYSW